MSRHEYEYKSGPNYPERIADLERERDEALAREAALKQLLHDMEWQPQRAMDGEIREFCPVCRRPKAGYQSRANTDNSRHRADCLLALALATPSPRAEEPR